MDWLSIIMDSLSISRNFQIVDELLRVLPIPWLIPLHGSSGQRHAKDPVRVALTSCATRAWRLEHSKGVALRKERMIKCNVQISAIMNKVNEKKKFWNVGKGGAARLKRYLYVWIICFMELNMKCKEPLLVELWSSSRMHVLPITLERTWDLHPLRRLLPDTNSFCSDKFTG